MSMDKNAMIAKVKEVVAAGSCCAELKAAGQAWLDAVGTPKQKEAAEKLVRELKEDVQSLDATMDFLKSQAAVDFLDAETVARMTEQGKKVKAAGGKYCFCPACQGGVEVLAHKEELFA